MTTEKIVKDIYHVGVNVNDMDKALEFYRDILGFKVKSDDIAEGEIADTGLGLKGVKFRQVYLQAENSELELFQYIKPLGKEIDIEQRNCDRGIRHIAFVVNDIFAILAKKRLQFASLRCYRSWKKRANAGRRYSANVVAGVEVSFLRRQ